LNVGPKSDVTIPEDQKEILLQIGYWLSINGETIYDTKYWTTFGEAQQKLKTDIIRKKITKAYHQKISGLLLKDNKLYAIVLDWPEDDVVNITTLAKNNEFTKYLDIKK